ncbi:Asp/Glu racemase [Mesorhizobium hungaricum]|uniref:Asp/Glu racemase n=1 Tax=Mesorhizobium hungaricum TaxID=1566387 RepID=A0A1C2DDZ0_9HYPH|nr:aspartate/glutamate racemase family protein [Mesorhizobium sp.]MDQ0330715.1 glutamate racemase [Mesorhizobium sp. YL-MeA3-2017]OCX12846.1 Asp/Glu racemase [Mesorhizobium hungaricum]
MVAHLGSPDPLALSTPIAVFDAGIGSYAIVELIRRRQPRRDILYFADRARFPYGGKGRDELLSIIQGTIRFLLEYAPQAIVVASNAPSIMVLDALRDSCPLPVYGVAPPLEEALARSRSGQVGIMGVRSLIESAELSRFVRERAVDPASVALINASPMVELVESGAFLSEPERTLLAVTEFAAEIAARHPSIDVLTLSSTHLPWLRSFFEQAQPTWLLLDPAENVVAALPDAAEGSGRTVALVTEGGGYDIAGFRKMLDKIGVDLPLTVVNPDIA